MKTITSTTKTRAGFRFLNKGISLFLLMTILAPAANKISGQRISPQKEIAMFNLTSERENKIERFSAKSCENKSYLQWHVKDERDGGIFIVQRSNNMMDFKILSIQNDVATEASITLMFSYIDKNPLPGFSYYRILKVYQDGSYYFSDMETIETEIPYTEEDYISRPFL